MADNFTLIHSLSLNNFNIELYTSSDYSGSIVTNEILNENLLAMNNQETPIELAQMAISFDGVKKIRVLNKSNELLLEVSESL